MAAGFGLAKAGSKTNTCLGSAPHPRPYAVEYLVSFCFNIDAQRLTCGRPDVGACECRHRRSPPSGLQRSRLKKPMQQLWQRWHLPARQSSSCIVELVVVCEPLPRWPLRLQRQTKDTQLREDASSPQSLNMSKKCGAIEYRFHGVIMELRTLVLERAMYNIYIYTYIHVCTYRVYIHTCMGVWQVLEAHGLLASLRAQMLRMESSHLTNALGVARQGQPWAARTCYVSFWFLI